LLFLASNRDAPNPRSTMTPGCCCWSGHISYVILVDEGCLSLRNARRRPYRKSHPHVTISLETFRVNARPGKPFQSLLHSKNPCRSSGKVVMQQCVGRAVIHEDPAPCWHFYAMMILDQAWECLCMIRNTAKYQHVRRHPTVEIAFSSTVWYGKAGGVM
jgi:hypothetical protein